MAVRTTLLSIAYVLGLLLLLSLGTWQINRGLHKERVLSLVATELKEQSALSGLPDSLNTLDYQNVRLNGQWDQAHTFLLANRIHQGQLGYEILTPFTLNSGQKLLINRGWIPERETNNLPTLSNEQPSGMIYLPKKGYTIGDAILTDKQNNNTWPKVSLYMDLAAFSKALKQPLSAAVMVLDADHKSSLTRIWKPIIIQPERHYAYAMQWYGLAIVFIIFGLIWYRRAKQAKI